MNDELQVFVDKLQKYSETCEDKFLDFQNLQFEAKEGEMKLYSQFRSYFFKNDPEKPKHPKIIHAKKQFCGFMGIPYSFFAKNPEYMKNQMVSCWLPTLKSDKSSVMGKLRKAPTDDYIIRALLPIEYSNISNAEILQTVSEALDNAYKIDFVIGDERDDLIFHVRMVSKETFMVENEECSLGFSVIVSELGAAPISVDTMLFRCSSKSAMVASYSGESFFAMEYNGMQPKELKVLFPNLVIHLQDSLPEIRDRVQSAKDLIEQKDDVLDLLRSIRLKKGLSDKFHTLLFQEVEKNPVENRWDLVNRMSTIAKDFDIVNRIKIEKVAGDLIGFNFEKI